MKKRLLIILIIVIFTAGLGILLYPLVSSIVNNINDRSEARQKQIDQHAEGQADQVYIKRPCPERAGEGTQDVLSQFDSPFPTRCG